MATPETHPLIAALSDLPATDGAPAGAGYTPVGQVIAGAVRQAILSGAVAPGTRIPQEVLAARFGVSRIPVREALRQLELEGLVVLVPHAGARVASLQRDELLEVYRMREALEAMAIAESAPLLDDAQLRHLGDLLDELEAGQDDPATYLDVDRRFHLATYAAAPLPRVRSMVESFWNTTQHYRRAFVVSLDDAGHALVRAEHRLILDALRSRDGEGAAERQRLHIRRTRLALMADPGVFGAPDPRDDDR
jgi:DNA-binding GntR family transcriptional regulator